MPDGAGASRQAGVADRNSGLRPCERQNKQYNVEDCATNTFVFFMMHLFFGGRAVLTDRSIVSFLLVRACVSVSRYTPPPPPLSISLGHSRSLDHLLLCPGEHLYHLDRSPCVVMPQVLHRRVEQLHLCVLPTENVRVVRPIALILFAVSNGSTLLPVYRHTFSPTHPSTLLSRDN